MSFADAADRVNRACLSTFGIPVDYHAGTATRRIRAAPGDVQEQPVETGRGIEMRQTCQWLISEAAVADLGEVRRGHYLTRPGAPNDRWTIESSNPDLLGGVTVSTVLSRLSTAGGRGVEAIS